MDRASHVTGDSVGVLYAAGNQVEVLFHAEQGQGRHGAQRGRKTFHGGPQLRGISQVREEAAALHVCGRQALAGEKQALGGVESQARDIALQPSLIKVQAQPRRGHEHLGSTAADAKIAG